MKLAALAIPLLLLTGCAAAPVVKVADVLAHCDAYKGKTVQAVGYLGQCAPRGCVLAAHRAAYKAFISRYAELQEAARKIVTDPAGVDAAQRRADSFAPMTLPDDPEWLAKAQPFVGGMVVVSGTVAKDKCTTISRGDWSATLQAADVRAATPADGVPSNTH